jgi:CRISPR/Cas system CMR-associated protein Cmr3 (group 5 of RAMP superfamily)
MAKNKSGAPVALTKEIKKIDREKLYTDNLYRFKYIADFAGFNEDDINAIHASSGKDKR